MFFEIITTEITGDCFSSHKIVSGNNFNEVRDFYMSKACEKYGNARKTCQGFVTEVESDFPEDNAILEVKIYKIDILNYKDNNIFDYFDHA